MRTSLLAVVNFPVLALLFVRSQFCSVLLNLPLHYLSASPVLLKLSLFYLIFFIAHSIAVQSFVMSFCSIIHFFPSYLRKILPSQAFRCCSSPGDLSILKLPKQKLNSPPFTSTSTCRQFYPVTSQVVPVEQGFSWANLRKIVKFNFLSSDTTFEFLFLPCQRSLGLFLVFLTIGGYRQAA